MKEDKFPKIQKSIQDFFEDEDGSITRGKALTIGGMVIVLGLLLADTAYATHGSHDSHASHVSYTNASNYGSTPTSTGRDWPSLSDMQSIDEPVLPKVSQSGMNTISDAMNSHNIEIQDTPVDVTPPAVGTPNTAADTPSAGSQINTTDTMQVPPDTPEFTVIED